MKVQADMVVKDTKEGPTYASEVAVGPDGDHTDIDVIPDQPTPPVAQKINVENEAELKVVVFDIETTGFGKFFIFLLFT